MSVNPAMRAAARSIYRNLYRAANTTFAGDERVLKAFRLKMRNDAIAARAIIDPETYEEQNQLGREVASILRKNVVQAVKVANTKEEKVGTETFRLRITNDTELGSNDTIKRLLPKEGSSIWKQQSAQSKQHDTLATDVASHDDPTLPRNYSQLKKAHKQRVVPVLSEDDLEENFVRGSGPGGQSINKTENNVQILHKPSGIRVSCQETRSLTLNRRIARKRLLEKLDMMMNPGLSKVDLEKAKQRERERRRRKKAKRKELEKLERDEDVDSDD